MIYRALFRDLRAKVQAEIQIEADSDTEAELKMDLLLNALGDQALYRKPEASTKSLGGPIYELRLGLEEDPNVTNPKA